MENALRTRTAIFVFLPAAIALAAFAPAAVSGQTCTMQAQMPPATLAAAHDAAAAVAAAVLSGDTDKLRTLAAKEYASNFGDTEALVRNLSPRLAGDTFTVPQVFLLEAPVVAAPATASDAAAVTEFVCTAPGSATEVDFSIPSLPVGTYAFAMAEGEGPHPWLLSMLLKQQDAVWKLAGFYPHSRTAAGHDGLWYWRAARDQIKAKKPWLAWFDFSEADALQRPANFVVSSHLEELRAEQHSGAPAELAEGVSPQVPLVLHAADGTAVTITDMSSEASDDGSQLNIVLHIKVDAAALPDAAAERARNLAAARTLIDAHPELRQGFASVFVYAETAGQNPFLTEDKMAAIP